MLYGFFLLGFWCSTFSVQAAVVNSSQLNNKQFKQEWNTLKQIETMFKILGRSKNNSTLKKKFDTRVDIS